MSNLWNVYTLHILRLIYVYAHFTNNSVGFHFLVYIDRCCCSLK